MAQNEEEGFSEGKGRDIDCPLTALHTEEGGGKAVGDRIKQPVPRGPAQKKE